MGRLLVVGAILVGGCFSPHPQAGAECGSGGACPDGLKCSAANTCELAAGSGSGDVDAPIDGCVAPAGMQMFAYTGAIESFVVPACVRSLRIEAFGAAGGDGLSPAMPGGKGARIAGTFAVTSGATLKILVGQRGIDGVTTAQQRAGSGGGGSFVVDASDMPLIVAGGGGGAVGGGFATGAGGPGQTGNDGQAGGTGANPGGIGGTNGDGGTSFQVATTSSGTYQSGTGGGGLRGDGKLDSNGGVNHGTPNHPGSAFIHGGAGGVAGTEGRDGGFGGGGSAGFTGGGGGGYSGGGSSASGASGTLTPAGGGGGSFNGGTAPINEAGVQTGNGSVVLTW